MEHHPQSSSCAYASVGCATVPKRPVLDSSTKTKGSGNTNKGKFKCRRCPKRFVTKGGLNLHLRQHNPELFLLTCPDCSFLTYQKGNYLKHTLVKHGKDADGNKAEENQNCPQCDFKAYTEEQIKAHVLRKHTDKSENPFKCEHCEYSSIEKAALAKHVAIVHRQERSFPCSICGFRSQTGSGLARHERGHMESRPHQCHLCDMAYADKKRLRDHLMKHSNVKPFACPHCQYSTNRNDNLKTHIKRNHLPP